MYVQQTLWDTPNAISSPGSAVGRKLSASPGGQQIALFGPDLAPVNHLAARANGREKRTNGTCGRSSSGLSRSADLTRSLGNRLKERLGLGGSMEYLQTWKLKTTPAGRQYWAHIASVRRISGKDCTGWPTPRTSDANGAGEHGQGGKDLRTTAQMAGWNTPRATDGTHGGPNQSGGALPVDAAKAISGPTQSGFLAKTEKPAGLVLNPHFPRWLMGYRAEWLCSEVLETLSSRK